MKNFIIDKFQIQRLNIQRCVFPMCNSVVIFEFGTFLFMKYQKEFSEDLNRCINDRNVMSLYNEDKIIEVLFEYWSMKDIDFYKPIFKPEYYEDINKKMEEFKSLSPRQQKIVSQLMIKKLKYLERKNAR